MRSRRQSASIAEGQNSNEQPLQSPANVTNREEARNSVWPAIVLIAVVGVSIWACQPSPQTTPPEIAPPQTPKKQGNSNIGQPGDDKKDIPHSGPSDQKPETAPKVEEIPLQEKIGNECDEIVKGLELKLRIKSRADKAERESYKKMRPEYAFEDQCLRAPKKLEILLEAIEYYAVCANVGIKGYPRNTIRNDYNRVVRITQECAR